MNAKKRNCILGYETLKTTSQELIEHGDSILTREIERILNKNQLPKSSLHESPHDTSTNLYQIDLKSKQIGEIISHLVDLEARFVNEKGETTAESSFYATLVDTWNSLL